MTVEEIKEWARKHNLSDRKLAKYAGISVPYFCTIMNKKAPITKRTQEKLERVMRTNDTSRIKNMSYLKIPFTRVEWQNMKYVFRDEEFVASQVHDLVMKAVMHVFEEQSTYLVDQYRLLTPEED